MKKFVTNIHKKQYWQSFTINSEKYTEDWEWNVIQIYKDKKQIWLGMGGAITEATTHNFYKLSQDRQEELLKTYYSDSGLNYNWARISIGSNDFCVAPYEYLKTEDLNCFDISHDQKEIIPFIKKILVSKKLNIVASPWSPPAFMKTNNSLFNGGKLLPKYYNLYADYLTEFLNEYNKNGIKVNFLTIQNEPNAKQKWESCQYSLNEQKTFIYKYLVKKLKNTKILVWDHNKENLYKYSKILLKNYKEVVGLAFHWYSGIHNKNLELVHQNFPKALLIHSEGCCGFEKYDEQKWLQSAELLMIDMIMDINSGMNAYIDWNLLLNFNGGPNHAENYCKSPIILNKKENDFICTPIYYYFGHIGHFVKPNSTVIEIDIYRPDILGCAFQYKNELTVILLNPTNEKVEINLVWNNQRFFDILEPHSIVTYVE